MSQTISATFEDGVFKPQQQLALASGTKVLLTVEPWEDTSMSAADFVDELERLDVEAPIDSLGRHLTRDELHERHQL